MKTMHGRMQNINGITPTEAVAFVSAAESNRIRQGRMMAIQAQLAVSPVVQLRVIPDYEQQASRLTIREHKRLSEFARWFLTLGRSTPLIISADNIAKLECDREIRYPTNPLVRSANSWYDPALTRSTTPGRATVALEAVATVPEFDDILVSVQASNVMLSAPNSPAEKFAYSSLNRVRLEEI